MAQLDRIRVASPCPVSWEQMAGNERVRFCTECRLHVYNFAELNRTEAENLLRTTEGRLCGRLYRRADGTLITKDCPVGLRAVRRRVAKIATAAFATLVSLGSAAVGQKQSDKDKGCKQQVTVTTKLEKDHPDQAKVTGTVFDQHSAVIAGAEVTLINRRRKQTETLRSETLRSNAEGEFTQDRLVAGVYDFVISSPGFKELKVKGVKIAAGETATIKATLLVTEELMGVIAFEEELQTPNGVIFKGDTIRKLTIH
jgi:Carboxypeptidase regulatory-like domain